MVEKGDAVGREPETKLISKVGISYLPPCIFILHMQEGAYLNMASTYKGVKMEHASGISRRT